MEVAYFALSDKQLYVNLDKLLGGQRLFCPPTELLGGLAPAGPPVPTPMDLYDKERGPRTACSKREQSDVGPHYLLLFFYLFIWNHFKEKRNIPYLVV